MRKEIVAIRGVDEEVLRKFKAKAVEERMKMGEALTLAMMRWLKEERRKRINPRNLLKLKPFDWGKGTEKTSKEIDEILYGSKR
jgi:hypothetical protein